jgi:hypothetical protein
MKKQSSAQTVFNPVKIQWEIRQNYSLKWGLNPRPFAYEANALPLSYQGSTVSLSVFQYIYKSGLIFLGYAV